MEALIGAVLVASLLGSLHCAGMCGALAAFAVFPGSAQAIPDGAKSRLPRGLLLHLAYHGGRLATYAALGAAAGLLGSALDLGGSFAGLQRVAGAAAGILLVAFGAAAILRLAGVRVPAFPGAQILSSWLQRGHEAALRRPPILRSLAVGLLTGLLPCGWLYAFVLAAAGTGDALRGALVLAAFWLGTLPVLAAVGGGARAIAGRFGIRLQLAAAALVIALGLLSIAGRFGLGGAPAVAASQAGSAPSSVPDAIRHVESLRQAPPPCCGHGE